MKFQLVYGVKPPQATQAIGRPVVAQVVLRLDAAEATIQTFRFACAPSK